MRTGTVAIILAVENGEEVWMDTVSDETEIQLLEQAIHKGVQEPLQILLHHRTNTLQKDENFGDFVENLLVKQRVSEDMKKHGVAWFESWHRIREYKKQEKEAAQTIAEFGLKIYQRDPSLKDFQIEAPGSKVRIRILHLPEQSLSRQYVA